MPAPDLNAYAAVPERIADAVRGLTPEQLRQRPIAGKWSALEVVAHLADTEQVYADRMKRIIAMNRPLIMGFDEGPYVAKLACNDRDLEEELALIRVTRSQMARILRTLPAEAFDRQAVHNEAGLVSLRQLVESMVTHVEHHCRHIDDKRKAMGVR